MTKVITYGTYDFLHHGHIKLLERARALGDYLIVGVTADDFDKTRGKINVQQSLMERVEAVRATGLADEIIVEEYEGQKIDDIRRHNVDIFTVGSDWEGQFDYLNEYCKVIYLSRTQGISSSNIRTEKCKLKIGLVGLPDSLIKFVRECNFVNGIEISGICTSELEKAKSIFCGNIKCTDNYNELLEYIDAVYIVSHPTEHYNQVYTALMRNKHVLCESPIAMSKKQCEELFALSEKQGCILMEGIKTAYSTAYSRLLLLAKSGKIGKVISVDATCTSLKDFSNVNSNSWNTICEWGPPALLPILQILGDDFFYKKIISMPLNGDKKFDVFTKVDLIYRNAVASLKIGKNVKSEGSLVVSGTKGYIYVPSPWWKTDYFEVRFENPNDNQRYFFQLDGEGIRYEIVAFVKATETKKSDIYIDKKISISICELMEDFSDGKSIFYIEE